ncbi:MutT/Nudix family protein [hydrothermal vent metagenome]|uniref:MutT/Nudix family protein n=1 Tax=hydrothermal vent metagenome TaxID=652676 RepID=A0A3B1A9Y4_9ZZZZ
MNYCNNCGNSVVLEIPEGDNLARYVCHQCNTVHYQNPKVVTGTLPVWQNKILLCKRAIEPRHGKWTLPAGFMENKETLEQAAIRESVEEANANIRLDGLYCLFSLPHISQIYVMYRAELLDLTFSPGIESLEVELFSEDEIPWQELAFKTIEQTLRYYFNDRKTKNFPLHNQTIEKSNK